MAGIHYRRLSTPYVCLPLLGGGPTTVHGQFRPFKFAGIDMKGRQILGMRLSRSHAPMSLVKFHEAPNTTI